MKIKIIFTILVSILILITGCTNKDKQDNTNQENEIIITNGLKHIVPLEDIQQGCFRGKDCIPSIDNPNFLKINEQNFMKSNDLIIGINLNNIQKAYPIKILNWHEIVNDNFENTPIVITYCPLCASSLAFERTINTKKVEFGVSGKLYNSDLIMYDRLTETYWSQIEGKAIVGELTGQKLKQIPVELMEWKDWIKVYPNTLVLSKETGYKRNYESYPYGNYETSEDIYFPIINKDTQERFHEKTLVYGIELNDQFKAYPKNLIDELKSFDDEFAETTLHFEIKNNLLTITDKKTNKEIQKISLFWFAWFTFHPGTEIFSVTNG